MIEGLFLTFEGIDGCGKSTQLRLVADELEKNGIPYIVTREPGGTPVAEKIRDIIVSVENNIVDTCEVLLYLASRAQHIEEKINPELKKGSVVLCSRFQEATIAYQGFGRNFSVRSLEELNHFATKGLMPVRTYIFDVDVRVAAERKRNMGKKLDRLERNSADFFNRVREGFKYLADLSSERVRLINGELSVDEVFSIVWTDIKELLRERKF